MLRVALMDTGNMESKVAADLRFPRRPGFVALNHHRELLYYVASCMPRRPSEPTKTKQGANHVQASTGRQ
jgi:hypothetical protein